ncbi:MAG: 4Fe-4S dicluster domain-containing protein [Chloroflexi bacterium]|nr:4Fe-4S dicluster domain-containing protein [Chloroflexota bacterium]
MRPEREILWNIGKTLEFLLLGLAALTVLYIFYRLYQRAQLWRMGQPVDRLENLFARILAFARLLLGQGYGHGRFLRDPYGGLMHLLIFWGASMLFLGTAIGTLEEWIFFPLSRRGVIPWPIGNWYLYSSLAWDLGGVMALVGLVMAVFRRTFIKKPHSPGLLDDQVILAFAILLIFQGFAVEGARQLGQSPLGVEYLDHPDWAIWSPGGFAMASLFHSVLGVGPENAEGVHFFLWWYHVLTVLGILIYAAATFSKFSHTWVSPLNWFFRTLRPRGTLPPIPNLETRETFGAATLTDFTWKQLLDTDACTRCGRCTDNCPANLTGKSLSPMMVIQNLKGYMSSYGPTLRAVGGNASRLPAELVKAPAGEVVAEVDLWSCVTCGACMEACPVFIEHVPTIVEMRRALVMNEGRMPSTAETALRSLETRGHPFAGMSRSRLEWTQGLDVPVVSAVAPEDVEVLYWVGCAASLEDRSMRIARAMATVLKKAGVKFAILGEEESCTGDPARRIGMEYLYQVQAQRNIETLSRYTIKKIVTTCPHCFNTIKNEYPQFGGDYEVVHHTQFLKELVASGRLKMGPAPERSFGVVTYHDPCYLGRHNSVYEPPRELAKGIPGVAEVREMAMHRNRAFCCGAGGGHMWMEDGPGREKINHRRTQHAIDTGADVIGTACPFCAQMFEDGVRMKGKEETMRVLDLSEMIVQTLESTPSTPPRETP